MGKAGVDKVMSDLLGLLIALMFLIGGGVLAVFIILLMTEWRD